MLHNPITPCIVLGVIFASAAHYTETKPAIILAGIVCLFLLHVMSPQPNDQILQTDISNLQDENENLKRNLMQVYSMLQKQNEAPSGPPPPIPPGMTQIPTRIEENNDDDDAKPYA